MKDVMIKDVMLIVEQAGSMLRQAFYDPHIIEYKSPHEIVTQTDMKIEKFIKKRLAEKYPGYGFLGEEETGAEDVDPESGSGSSYMWIVDPIDGTTNFSIHNPFFNISVALVKVNGKDREPVLGIVHVPMTKETYYAEKGKGSFLKTKMIKTKMFETKMIKTNNNSFKTGIHNSDTVIVRAHVHSKVLDKSVLAFCNSGAEVERIVKVYNILKPKARIFSRFGAAALELALTGAGHINGFLALGAKPWDVAAGVLIVEEAGGKVTNLKGEKFKLFGHAGLLCAPPELHAKLLSLVKDV